MQATYARYKELKRLIRDKASIDIQRVYRGHRTKTRADIMKFRSQRATKVDPRLPLLPLSLPPSAQEDSEF
jgi:hypothetical protein